MDRLTALVFEVPLFSFFKRPTPPPADLRTELIARVARKDLRGLAALVRERRTDITAAFRDWTTVPLAMREEPQLLANYAEMLIGVARLIQQDGDPSLMKMLEGDPADSPMEAWNEQIALAATFSDQQRFGEAARVLASLADQISTLRGSAIDFYRPRVLGKLGIALYQSGDVTRAREVTEEALAICRQLGDEEGVQAYDANLRRMA